MLKDRRAEATGLQQHDAEVRGVGDSRAGSATYGDSGPLGQVAEAIVAHAAGDYKRMMATGVVCMKLRSVRGKNDVQRVYREYEIDTGVIEALNSVEKRAAIETGQEQENIQISGQVTSKAIALSKVMTIPELEVLEAKMVAAMEAEKAGGKVIEAPK